MEKDNWILTNSKLHCSNTMHIQFRIPTAYCGATSSGTPGMSSKVVDVIRSNVA